MKKKSIQFARPREKYGLCVFFAVGTAGQNAIRFKGPVCQRLKRAIARRLRHGGISKLGPARGGEPATMTRRQQGTLRICFIGSAEATPCYLLPYASIT